MSFTWHRLQSVIATSKHRLKSVPLSVPNIDEDVHGAAAHHSLFARFFSCQREMMQCGCSRSQRHSCLGPNLCLHTAPAYGPGNLTVFEKEHFGAAPLRSGPASMRYG